MNKNILGVFDGSELEGISALIDKLEQSSFDYLKLESDGLKLVIGKNGMDETVRESAPLPEIMPVTAPAPRLADNAPVVSAEPATGAAPADISERDGITIVRAPSYGLFYAQSEPGAPPYVKIGDTISKGDTVGLLEIMKTFNAVSAPVSGEVVAIHVKNEELLEPDQPLISIKTA